MVKAAEDVLDPELHEARNRGQRSRVADVELAVVFGFGLLHGLGFASSLGFTDELGGQLLASLFSFNVGIEVGQALIVAALFPALLLVRRMRWSPLAHAGATTVAAGFGFVWFVERLLA